MGLRSRLAIPSASEHDYHDQISTNKEQQPVPLGVLDIDVSRLARAFPIVLAVMY